MFGIPTYIEGEGEEGAFDPRMTETEIANVVDRWLKRESWETFPEVVVPGFPGRPDIVATRRGICQVVECKRSFGLNVLDQAVRWRLLQNEGQFGIPHLIWIVVQRSGKRRSPILDKILDDYGIGLLVIEKHQAVIGRSESDAGIPQTYQLMVAKYPRIQPGSRRSASLLMEKLNPDMRVATPGARGGKTTFMTPFRRTMGMVDQYLRQSPGKERHIDHIIRYLNENGGHHYGADQSAKSSIPKHLDRLGYPRARHYGPWFKAKEEPA